MYVLHWLVSKHRLYITLGIISGITCLTNRNTTHKKRRDIYSLVGRLRQEFAAFDISASIYLFLHCTMFVRHMFFYSVGVKFDCPLSY